MTDAPLPNKAQSIPPRYEAGGVNSRGFFIFVIGFVLAGVATQMFLWWSFGRFNRSAIRNEPGPASAIKVLVRPPEPELQPSPGHDLLPPDDLQRLRAQERNQLGAYGWVDGEHRTAHIPIDRAMDLVVERGVSPATQPTTPPAKGGPP